jgi:hypothetical protein
MPSGAEARELSTNSGTAEAVPFLKDRVPTQTLELQFLQGVFTRVETPLPWIESPGLARLGGTKLLHTEIDFLLKSFSKPLTVYIGMNSTASPLALIFVRRSICTG